MLKASLTKYAETPISNTWKIHFREPNNAYWDEDFVGSVYHSHELQQLGYSDSYEFYFCEPTTSEIIRMIFPTQWELMKFLTHVGNEMREQAARRQISTY